MSLLLGAVADDFTGATDLANTLVKGGLRTVQAIGVPPDDADFGDAQVVVAALKSRSSPARQAIAQSRAALARLQALGARQILFKYCSTFDSTADGNIGPVADALMDDLKTDFALVCPAFPGAGRTIYKGWLFVGDDPLAESSMKDHPLTPMRESSLIRLMAAQSTRKVGLIAHEIVRAGADAIRARIAALKADGIAYGVIDAIEDADLMTIGAAAADHALITGGSGVALGLPRNLVDAAAPAPAARSAITGRAVALAGSCSVATRGQIAHVVGRWPSRKIDVDAVVAGDETVETLASWAAAQDADAPILLYASDDPEAVAAAQRRHGPRAAEAIEAVMGGLAQALTDAGARRLVVAGGETSGAVVSALGAAALRIGPEIDPGVPWTETIGGDRPRIALALKSGNFGAPDFFERALGMSA